MNVDSYGSLLETQDVNEDVEFDPLLSGAATSIFSSHNEEGILQWHDVIIDWF